MGECFLLVPAYPGCPGSKAVKRSLLLLLLSHICLKLTCLCDKCFSVSYVKYQINNRLCVCDSCSVSSPQEHSLPVSGFYVVAFNILVPDS